MKKFILLLPLLYIPQIISNHNPISEEIDGIHTHQPSQDFFQFLNHCNYAAHCIKYLRDKYPHDQEKIDSILLPRYIHEYQMAVSNIHSISDKLDHLEKMGDFLLRTPSWIDQGHEPCLANVKDGSDRGGLGLRYKALNIVKTDIQKMQRVIQ